MAAIVVQFVLGYFGIGGPIPVIAVFGGMYVSAKFLCKKYDEKRAGKSSAVITRKESISTSRTDEQRKKVFIGKPAGTPVLYCRKCGKKLIENSDFCSYCGTAAKKER